MTVADSEQLGSPQERLRRRATAAAEQLRGRGLAPEQLMTTTEREEERTSGFLGRNKQTVTVAETNPVLVGWQLWSQTMNDALYGSSLTGSFRPLNRVSNEVQIWLQDDGEVVTVVFDRDHVIMANRHVENVRVSASTDDELLRPDYEWHAVEEQPNSSVQFKKFWTNGGEQPSGQPCDGLTLGIENLVAS